MGKKLTGWKTKGMNQDLSVSAFNPEFAFENVNMRLSTNEGNTLLSWVNERGTEKLTVHSSESNDAYAIQGEPVGTAVLNHLLIVFTIVSAIEDRIYKLWFAGNDLKGELLYKGPLGFSNQNPLETLVSYEADNVQKVYWTDGVNQPRVINIEGDYGSEGNWKDPRVFDFVPELDLGETVTVKKILGGGGMFASGVIQYAFTYYNKYGQESNIFHTTPLLYISFADRGAAPDEKVDNAFKITVNDIDEHFDYLRIYSIQRTSLNGTPICKRVQDISLQGVASGGSVSYTDTGYSGETIDPTELLYKGGEVISAGTIEQKDGTLFLGNIGIERNSLSGLRSTIRNSNTQFTTTFRNITFTPSSVKGYHSQLTGYDPQGNSVPCGGFKKRNYYRCGVQFQHKSGKWSEPFFIKDVQVAEASNYPAYSDSSKVVAPLVLQCSLILNTASLNVLSSSGYKKARPVVVFPKPQDRIVLCQGVGCATLSKGGNKYQSSWFFRTKGEEAVIGSSGSVTPKGYITNNQVLPYINRNIQQNYQDTGAVFDPSILRSVEIEGAFTEKFSIVSGMHSFHSPDVEFDEQLWTTDYNGFKLWGVGQVTPNVIMSDIEIQTETPTVSNTGGGFVHKSFFNGGIVAGLFYDDFIVDDKIGDDNHLGAYPNQRTSAKWMVYPWQSSGSLNNDINRPADKGVASAILKKKIISNLRFTETDWIPTAKGLGSTPDIKLFNSDEVSIVKMQDGANFIYQGNVDTMLMPDQSDGKYFAWEGASVDNVGTKGKSSLYEGDISFNRNETSFTSNAWWKTYSLDANESKQNGIRKWMTNVDPSQNIKSWVWAGADIGDDFVDLAIKKKGVRMRYKSTSHLVIRGTAMYGTEETPFIQVGSLPVVEVFREIPSTILFGGTSDDALRENDWVPCGEAVPISSSIPLHYDYGDTYFQRYDCLKTYPFSPEDENQVVEIGSFMLETYVNIDGRYDRNRGQMNNLNMTPKNFNLLNPVYSQVDNFFTYKILDDKFYKTTKYPNQITWSKTKQSSADVDMWTNVTLGSVLELDGDKGSITALKRFDNQLIAFQDTGISQILYNENTQISTTNGVPIEIANSGKVQGKRYISNTIGCSNKWSIAQTPSGLYFMDSHEKGIYLFAGQLMNLSVEKGFNTWCKKNIPSPDMIWDPYTFGAFVSYYDKQNQDVLFINGTTALSFSEKVGAFTSFYNYGGTPYFCNLDDIGLWVRRKNSTPESTEIWRHQTGDKYCRFFDTNYGYSMTLVGNPEPQLDKIFTNLEFRANVEGDGEYNESTGKFTPALPFDQLEVWNEYQHGRNILSHKTGHDAMVHYPSTGGLSLKRKFRIWRCDIPRDNIPVTDDVIENEKTRGIYRLKAHPIDRMRNTWLYLKLSKSAEVEQESEEEPVPMSDKVFRTEVHDILMTYYS